MELRNVGLFGALPEEVLQVLARELEVLELAAGSYVFREGEPGNCMFVVLQGDMDVLKKSRSGHDSRVAVLGPATVLTASPSQVIKLTAADLDRLYRSDVKAYSLIVLNIAREMSRRLRVADGILADLIASGAEGYDHRRPGG
jgi:CRP/FNR family transcriptional regulator, cyclic AMP receptor protein